MAGFYFNRCAIFAACLGVSVLIGNNVNAAVSYRTVALSGDHAPGMDPGVTYKSAGAVQFLTGHDDTILVGGDVQGPGFDGVYNFGLWAENGLGGLELAYTDADAAMGTAANDYFKYISYYRYNHATGQISFYADAYDASDDSPLPSGIWAGTAGSLELIASPGGSIPGLDPSEHFNGVGFLRQNGNGQFVFQDSQHFTGVGGTFNDRVWFYSDGTLELVMGKGTAAPDRPAGAIIENAAPTAINDAGQLLIGGSYILDSYGHRTIWKGTHDALSVVASQYEQAPDLPAGVQFDDFYSPTFNGSGQVLLLAKLRGTGVDDTNNSGVFSDRSGTLSLIVREGDQAPGLAPGVRFGDGILTFPERSINNAGKVTFTAHLTGPGVDNSNGNSLWTERDASLELVARGGDFAPGTSAGEVFAAFFYPVMNTVGDVVFGARLEGPGVEIENERGIWALDSAGILQLIVRTGDLFDVNDDPAIEDLRVIRYINTGFGYNDADGVELGFNDAGQIALGLTFTDGTSGAFVVTIRLPGDLDGDGFVGLEDIEIILNNWNQNVPPADTQADPSGDGYVGLDDLDIVINNWNNGHPPNTNTFIPEPLSVVILGTGVMGLFFRRYSL